MADNQSLADLLRQKADTLLNLPSEAARFISDPQAIIKSMGYTPSQQLSGYSAGYSGVPAKPPSDIGVLDPNNNEYNKGYESGEFAANVTPFAALAGGITKPFVKPVARAIGEQAWNATENMMQQQGLMPSVVPSSRKEIIEQAFEGTMPHYKDYENLSSVFEKAGLKIKETGSSKSNSKYVEIEDPVSGEVITARFANHPQSGNAMTLHGPADIEIGDIFKHKSWKDAVNPILDRINKARKEFGDELLTLNNKSRK